MHVGEENRRHRRTHVAQKHYVDPQGRKGVRLQFYLQGVIIARIGIVMSLFVSKVRNKGTVQLDAREDSGGRMQTRFLVVEVTKLTVHMTPIELSSFDNSIFLD